MLFAAKDLAATYNSVVVTPFIMGDFSINFNDETNDSKPFGTRYNQSKLTGDTTVEDFGWRGLYDDDNDAPKRLWDVSSKTPGPSTAPVPLVLTLGTPSGTPTDSVTIPVLVKSFKVLFSRNKIHEYEVMFTKGVGDITRT